MVLQIVNLYNLSKAVKPCSDAHAVANLLRHILRIQNNKKFVFNAQLINVTDGKWAGPLARLNLPSFKCG